MSNFGGLSIAATGLDVHRRRIEIISGNIANVNTPGYRRRVADLGALDVAGHVGLYASGDEHGGGVEIRSIRRLEDFQLEQNARAQRSTAGAADATLDVHRRIEEAIGGLTGGGIGDELATLWNSFDDLGNAPDDLAMRQIVLQNLDNTATAFNQASTNLIDLHTNESLVVADQVDEFNRLTDEIASLDQDILASSQDDIGRNGLIDRRDQLIDELSDLAPVTVAPQPDGQVEITIDGFFVVSNGDQRTIGVEQVADPAMAALGLTRTAVVSSSGRELRIEGGAIGGRLQAINGLIPEAMGRLDTVATETATQVNTIHSAGVGLDGGTGRDVFDLGASGSRSIAVSADVASTPEALAAAGAGAGPLDDGTARALAELAEAPDGPRAAFDEFVTSVAGQVAAATNRAEATDMASATAIALVQGATGVSLDEELTDLITAQRSYEAAARMITAVDELLDTIINRTGVIGR
ncbi:MAG: flagellar hook-associated protein FlgK [Acidimicrobiales bacterium]